MHPRAYMLLLATTLFWGGNAVAGKLAVDHVSPMLLNAARWVIAFAIMAPLGWRQLRADWPRLRERIWLVSILGAAGFSIFTVSLYSALNYTSAINVSIEQAGIPMLIFLLNFLLFGLAARPLQLVGLALSVVGIALTAIHGDPARLLALDVNRGDTVMLIGVIVYSAYTVALRHKPNVHWMSLMIVMLGAASVASLPFVAAEFALGAGLLPDAQGWAIIAYVVIFPSILSQIFYIRGVELIGANRAGLFVNMVPIFGTLLSIVLLGEAFHLYHGVAIALVFGGIWLAEAGRGRVS